MVSVISSSSSRARVGLATVNQPPWSPINAFSIEEFYTLEFSESLQENTGYWQAPNTYEAAGEQVATSPTKNRKKATRDRQKRMIENNDAPRQTPWTTEEEVALAKGRLAVSKSSKDVRSLNVRRVLGKWKTMRPSMIRFSEIYSNVMRMAQESGAGDEDYIQTTMIHYEVETEIPFKLLHCWEVLKDRPKWQEIALPKFSTGSGGSKRHKSSGSSLFNTESGEASINLNTNVGDNDEDEVQKIRRPEGRDKARAAGRKNKQSKPAESSTLNEDEIG
nr:hypothetical protein [Tanacetum cinerariifolium]